jgi:hypothetical protein
MTQTATSENVTARFTSISLSADGLDYRIERRGPSYVATAHDGAAHSIALLTGSHHMQIWWFETGEGRSLTQLPFVYLNGDQRWVPRDAIFIKPPVTLTPGPAGRWNASCIACHTTYGRPLIDARGHFDTRVAELGIACEACHGPADAHVQHNASPLERYRRHLHAETSADIVQPAQLSHERSSLVCGQCHATWLHDGPAGMRRWNEHGFAYRPGGDPADSMLLMQPMAAARDARVARVIAEEPQMVSAQFWSDGQVRVSGREFNGMIDSPCYARGELTCLSCHRMHQAAADARAPEAWADTQLSEHMDSDEACLQCHNQLRGQLAAHTHHAPASQGSRCYNCHMPYTSYGLLTAMRSHRIGVPDVASNLATGRPNACNACHLDKSLGWTAGWLNSWYRVAAPALSPEQEHTPFALLFGLTGDAGQRALIAWALGWAPARQAAPLPAAATLLGVLMDDPYDAVRYIAARSLGQRGQVVPDYDFAARPGSRPPIADAVVSSARQQPSAAERSTIERLRALRDDRPVMLLE